MFQLIQRCVSQPIDQNPFEPETKQHWIGTTHRYELGSIRATNSYDPLATGNHRVNRPQWLYKREIGEELTLDEARVKRDELVEMVTELYGLQGCTVVAGSE